MIKSLCDVRKFWDISRSINNYTLQNCVFVSRHEALIPRHMVILNLWAYLKTVTSVLSLCPPSQQDGSKVDESDSPIKLGSTKKKRRRILSDSEEQDVDTSSSSVPPEKKKALPDSPVPKQKRMRNCADAREGIPSRNTAAAPFKGMKQLLPSIAKRVEAAKVAKASKELEEEGMKVGVETENAHIKEDEVEKCSKTGSAESVSSNDKKPIIKEEEDEAENQDIEGNHIKEGDKLDKNIKETSSEKPVHSFFAPRKSTNTTQQSKTSPSSVPSKPPGSSKMAPKDTEMNYDPTKSKYHPIHDACWNRKDKVPYLALAVTLEKIEGISGRLKIIEILANYFRSVIILSPEDLLPSVYLCLNKLGPAYEGIELGVAETTLMKAIAQSTGRTPAQIKTDANATGDLGIVAEQSRSSQCMIFQPARLTVQSVFSKLKAIAQMSGHSSVSKKVDKIQGMFVACRHSEARFLIRSLAGKLRVGLAEQSVLQAVALACAMTPPEQQYPPEVVNAAEKMSQDSFKAYVEEQALILKTTYCECPNYDKIIPVVLEKGIRALPDHCHITPGIPLKPMLAHPTKGVQEVLHRFENLKFICEWKYDGERAQIHLSEDGAIRIYSHQIGRAHV